MNVDLVDTGYHTLTQKARAVRKKKVTIIDVIDSSRPILQWIE